MKTRRVIAPLVALISLGLVGCSGGVTDPNPSRETAPGEPTVAATSAPVGPLEFFDDTEITGDGPTLDEFMVLAGRDIVPGVYRTVGQHEDDGGDFGILFDTSCKWGVYSDSDGGLQGLIDAGSADGGRPTITVEDGQLARSSYCGRWERVDEEALFANPDAGMDRFGDGHWLVGEDIRPGVYRTERDADPDDVDTWCALSTSTSWRNDRAEFIDVVLTSEGPTEITLTAGHEFISLDCGEWAPVPAAN